ncbi:MAG: DNA polymerase IV, partial [Alphaproteobacteria bacterium]
GIGVSDLGPGRDADPPDLAEPGRGRRRVLETALDDLRTRMGSDVVHQGRGLPAGRKSGPRRARTP